MVLETRQFTGKILLGSSILQCPTTQEHSNTQAATTATCSRQAAPQEKETIIPFPPVSTQDGGVVYPSLSFLFSQCRGEALCVRL